MIPECESDDCQRRWARLAVALGAIEQLRICREVTEGDGPIASLQPREGEVDEGEAQSSRLHLYIDPPAQQHPTT